MAESPSPRSVAATLSSCTAVAAALVLLVACGSGGDPAPEPDLLGAQTATQEIGGEAGGETGDRTQDDGAPGGGDELPPDPGGGGVSIDVATLPFGGAAEPTGELTQCVTVGWNGDVVVPHGATLTIAVRLTSDLLALDPGACTGYDGPACDGLQAGPGRPGPCTIGVTATRAPADGEPPPSTLMSGRLTCAPAAAGACAQTARALEGSVTTIQFELPVPPEAPSPTTPEPLPPETP